MHPFAVALALLVLLLVAVGGAAADYSGTARIDFFGYQGCLQLRNAETSVVLDPNCGGRVLSYNCQGQEAIPLNPAQQGYTWKTGDKVVDPYGGRFDVGPEGTTPRHLDLWLGRWEGEFTGPREARLTSPVDSNLKLQLIRTFRLDEAGSHLRCTQKMIHRGEGVRRCCHWSRTFALGNGICVVPLNPASRFPRKYLTYGPGSVMDYAPAAHENVRVRDGFLEVRGTPPFSKFMVDPELPVPEASPEVSRPWLGYLMPTGQVFVKRFPVYPRRSYAEMSAASLSLYYYPFTADREKAPQDRSLPIDFCELEPIGPTEFLQPGQSASYTEDWWLLPFAFPQPGTDADLQALQQLVLTQTR